MEIILNLCHVIKTSRNSFIICIFNNENYVFYNYASLSVYAHFADISIRRNISILSDIHKGHANVTTRASWWHDDKVYMFIIILPWLLQIFIHSTWFHWIDAYCFSILGSGNRQRMHPHLLRNSTPFSLGSASTSLSNCNHLRCYRMVILIYKTQRMFDMFYLCAIGALDVVRRVLNNCSKQNTNSNKKSQS